MAYGLQVLRHGCLVLCLAIQVVTCTGSACMGEHMHSKVRW